MNEIIKTRKSMATHIKELLFGLAQYLYIIHGISGIIKQKYNKAKT
jgi:hypothetical protein